jgi:4-amino-4-deoxy-L-arabinose transferase-like glycosyltransferase
LPGAALLLVLAASAAVFAYQGWSVVTYPYPVDYGEGPLLDQAVRLARSENIYDRDLTAAPYTVANYPPLYVLAQTPWVRIFGPALWYGRLLSWLCVVASALLIALILQALAGEWLASIAGGACLLVMPYAAYWAPLFRTDSLALALSLAALYVLVRTPPKRWALLTSAVLLTAAVYTRQTYVLAAPLAAFAWLVAQEGNRRRGTTLAALVVGTGGSVLCIVNLATDGGFLFHTFTANVNAYRVDRLVRYLRELAFLLPVFLFLGAAFVVAGRRIHTTSWRLVAPYFAGALLAGLTIGKVGSNVNYFLELCAALSLAAGATLAGLRSRPMARNVVILVLLLQLSVLLGGTRYQQHLRWKLEQRAVMDRLMHLVHHTDGTVLADEALGLLPLDGRPVHVQPFELTQLAHRGAWDPAPFLAELDRRAFAAVLVYRVPWSEIHRTRWTPEMLERLERGYDASGVVGHTVVYRPKEF